MAFYIRRDDDRTFLADDCTEERWTDDLGQAAEFDSAESALADIEGCGLMDCEIIDSDEVAAERGYRR